MGAKRPWLRGNPERAEARFYSVHQRGERLGFKASPEYARRSLIREESEAAHRDVERLAADSLEGRLNTGHVSF